MLRVIICDIIIETKQSISYKIVYTHSEDLDQSAYNRTSIARTSLGPLILVEIWVVRATEG